MRHFCGWGLRGPAEWRQGFFGIIVVKSPNFSFVASPSLSEHASREGIGATGDCAVDSQYRILS